MISNIVSKSFNSLTKESRESTKNLGQVALVISIVRYIFDLFPNLFYLVEYQNFDFQELEKLNFMAC